MLAQPSRRKSSWSLAEELAELPDGLAEGVADAVALAGPRMIWLAGTTVAAEHGERQGAVRWTRRGVSSGHRRWSDVGGVLVDRRYPRHRWTGRRCAHVSTTGNVWLDESVGKVGGYDAERKLF